MNPYRALDLFPCTKYNNHFYISTDETFCPVVRSHGVSFYGLTNRIVATIATHFKVSTKATDEVRLIQSLGQAYVTLLNNTTQIRASIPTLLSEF
ncbi:hypothetical protein INT47_010797 [Mucor saturninus]|uniref:Uncharacterized protein n=1 Tax=Mucor saturninus TaxID=64648 RepID=A0A8H7QQ11_9FUNG|nr:hypothetical protein INT47_010797 [Mucor saturninus]